MNTTMKHNKLKHKIVGESAWQNLKLKCEHKNAGKVDRTRFLGNFRSCGKVFGELLRNYGDNFEISVKEGNFAREYNTLE